jgi:hypothetical protein
MKVKREEKKHTCGPRDVVDVSWAFFSFSPPPHYSTHNPPHKQLLVRLGVGGVSFAVPIIVAVVGPFPSRATPWPAPSPVVPIPIAPCFHPASSCSRQQLGVPLWWWVGGGGSDHRSQ